MKIHLREQKRWNNNFRRKIFGMCSKGGSAIVTDVLKYGEKSTKNGLNLISGPGNDQIAVTVLAASGAHMVLFTTGRELRLEE